MDGQYEYFTEEHLRRWLSLPRRYPLWCGSWDIEHLLLPEATRFHPATLEQALIEELEFNPETIHAWIDDPPGVIVDIATPAPPSDWDLKYGPKRDDDPETGRPRAELLKVPKIFTLVLGGLAVIWGQGDTADEAAALVLQRLQDVLAGLPRPLTKDDATGFINGASVERQIRRRMTLRELLRTRRELLSAAEGRRDTASLYADELRWLWMRVGEASGIVPYLQGGKTWFLPNSLLASLYVEAQQLVREIAHHKDFTVPLPDTADMRHFQHKDPRVWRLLFDFPLLQPREVVEALGLKPNSAESRFAAAAKRILASRLGTDVERLNERLTTA